MVEGRGVGSPGVDADDRGGALRSGPDQGRDERCASPIAYVRSEMSTLNAHAGLPSSRRPLIVLVLAFLSALLVAAAPAHAVMMAVDPQTPCEADGDNVQSILQAHDATVLRIVLPDFPAPDALRCVARAKAEGYRVYISLQYQNAWSPSQVAAYFARALPQYAPFAWAVGVGNEQDIISKQRLAQGTPRTARVCTGTGRRRRCRRDTGAYYRQVWNAVEPVLARVAPKALRVYGETSPWGFTFLKDSFQTGRPRGAQVVAFHCYDTKWGGLRSVPRVAAWAGTYHLPLWCSEMSDALHPLSWGRRDASLHWETLLGGIEHRSPNLAMVSYYQWPQIGAR
jgi:hypothetical protein